MYGNILEFISDKTRIFNKKIQYIFCMAERKELNLNWIDDLKSRADICYVIGSYVSLEKKGQKYWACCPFHAERTPSFAVDELRGSWYCFGACHEGGDVISFEMKINNIDFQEAVKRLASKVGMKLPESFNFEKHDKVSDRDYNVLVETAKFYRENLQKNPSVIDYLHSRNLSDKTISQFGLGYSPDYNSLVNHLVKKGYSRKELLDLGLLAEHDGRFYDFLAERMVVPIFDPYGKVIAFGGRILKKPPEGKAVAKYKNTRETKLFIKNKVLYGMNFVRKARIGNPINDIIIVEGYMDVIGLHQAGIRNVVASMGTSLTDNQAKLLKAMVDTVYICYDGDYAGQTSTLRGLKVLKAHDLNVKIMTMPDGMDPDELVVNGPEPFLDLKDKAMDLYDYLLYRAEDGLNMATPQGKINYAKNALAVISDLPTMEREVYLGVISKKSSIPTSKLRTNLIEISGKNLPNERTQEQNLEDKTDKKSKKEDDSLLKSGRFILNSLVVKEELLDDRLDVKLFASSTQKVFYSYIVECLSQGRRPIASTAYNIEGVDSEEISKILSTNVDIPDYKAYYNDCIRNLLIYYYSERVNELKELSNGPYDDKTLNKYKSEIRSVMAKLTELKKK